MSPTTAKSIADAPRPQRRGWAAKPALALAASLAAAAPSTAHASGFLGARYGADFGNPIGDNAYSIYFNPAAIAATEKTQLTLDAVLVYRAVSYNRNATSPSESFAKNQLTDPKTNADYQAANTGKGTLGNILASPFVGFVTDFGNPKLPIRAGLAVYIPFGGQSSWDRHSDQKASGAFGGYDGPQRWSTISGRVTSLYITPAVSFTIPDTRLSFGLNGSVVSSTTETVRARNSDGSDNTTTANGTAIEGRSLVEVKNTTFAGALGIYYEAIPKKLMLGASFTARPGFGQMRLKGTLKTQFGQDKNDTTNDVELLQTLPDVWRLGVGYRVSDKVMLRADFNYVNWSVFKRQCLVTGGISAKCELYDNGAEANKDNVVIQSIKRDWHDAFGVRVSGSYYLSDATELFGSLGYDSSAVPDRTLDATFIDADKLLASAGVRQRFGKSFLLGVSYNHAYFFSVDNKSSELDKLEQDSKQPSANGKYTQQYYILDLNGTVFF